MLAKKYRLPGPLIPEVLKKGKVSHFSLFSLRCYSIKDSVKDSPCLARRILKKRIEPLDYPLFAFVFSKKLDKRAVKRNKAKRRLAEAVRHLLPKIKPGYALVFLAKKGILELKYQEIFEEMERVFGKIGVIRE